MKYFLIAGEASGDLHASNLMAALKAEDKAADFRFFGGDLMQRQGGQLLKHYREMAFMGFVPVLMHLRSIFRNLKACGQAILEYHPDAVILVDYPGFNLKIAKFVKKNTAVPVYYYISPKVWAWKEYRVKSFKKYVDKMLCILPFEVDFYQKRQYRVDYVGNPTVDAVAAFRVENTGDSSARFRQENGLDDKPVIALLAGSRKQEIKDNLPAMLEAVSRFDGYQAVIAGAPGLEESDYRPFLNARCRIVFGQTYRLLEYAAAALVTSGTATLETALFRTPQVVCYKTPLPHLVYWVYRHLLTTPYISLVNLIAGKTVVQELFAKFFSVASISGELSQILNNASYRNEMLAGYDRVIAILGGPGASERAAHLICGSQNKEK
ncbi:MAG: lipid-A-disaccharide synthase [Prevotella sp.]|jgi:lipid-A-disaccharide synthase|nr:lipid-A-disaccharide synthase [Prevotella sp.]